MSSNVNVLEKPIAKVRKPQKRGLLSARKLLDTAALLFVEKGYDATSVDDIVHKAESSKGTFYHHYESKGALLLALRERVIEQHQEDVTNQFLSAMSNDPHTRLDAWITAVIDAYVGVGPLHEVVFSNHPESRWTVSDMEFMNDFAEMLGKGNEEKAWNVPNPKLAATFIYRAIIGTIDDLILHDKDVSAMKQDIITLARQTVGL